MREEVLAGGLTSSVVRVGDTVRRARPERHDYVVAVLQHLERVGWPGAPRFLGLDEQGRQILTYLEGHVAWEPAQAPAVWSRASLERVATLVRQLHDLTVGTYLAGDGEVVCHNDLSPTNTVYRDTGTGLKPVAFLDWDAAAPGRRIHDVAQVCWRYLDLGPRRTSPVGVARLIRLVCDAYGLRERAELIETIRWSQVRRWGAIEDGATAGDPAMVRLREAGVADEVKAAYEWVTEHRETLESALV